MINRKFKRIVGAGAIGAEINRALATIEAQSRLTVTQGSPAVVNSRFGQPTLYVRPSGLAVVRKNSTGDDFGPRRRLNLIEGTNITLTVADDATNDEVDVTIAASASGATFSGARVYHDSTQTFNANTITTLAFNSERWDTDAYHDNSTNNSRLTVPSDGYYSLGCNLQIVKNPTAFTLPRAYIELSTGEIVAHWQPQLTSATFEGALFNAGAPWPMETGDYAQLKVACDQNAQVPADSSPYKTLCEFWIYRLGDL